MFRRTLQRGTGTGTADDLHDNVLNVCVPPMWLASAGLKGVRPSPVGTRHRVATKRNRSDRTP